MHHTFSALALLALVACGGDASPSTAASASTSSVSNDDRRALTPAQLASRFPTDVEGRRASLNRITDSDTWSGVLADYTDPADPGRSILVEVRDLIDEPNQLQEGRRRAGEPAVQYDEGYGADHIENRVLDDGTLAEEIETTEDSGRRYASLFLVVGDRFTVHIVPGRTRNRTAEPSLDDLWSFYEASGVARLADAPVYADAAPAELPAWASEDVPVTAPPPAAVAALPACDDVLPLAEVERVCRVSGLRVTPTPFLEEGLTSCNRKYSFPRNLIGLVFIVSRFGDEATARSAQGVASDIESPQDLRYVPGLGDAATRYVQEGASSRTTTRVLAVAVGVDLVEMKSTVMADEPDAEVCTLDQMETLARGVAERLRP